MKHIRLKTVAMLLAAASFPLAAWGQEPATESEDERRSGRPGDIVVTGRSLATDEVASPLPVQILAGEELAHRRQGGLDETLAGLPGIHLDNFGSGASRPVIRDQTLPRISPSRLGARYYFDAGPISAEAEYYHIFAPDKILSYETRTGGYEMVNATLSYQLGIGPVDKSVEFYVRGTNLLNELAFARTQCRFRDAACLLNETVPVSKDSSLADRYQPFQGIASCSGKGLSGRWSCVSIR